MMSWATDAALWPTSWAPPARQPVGQTSSAPPVQQPGGQAMRWAAPAQQQPGGETSWGGSRAAPAGPSRHKPEPGTKVENETY